MMLVKDQWWQKGKDVRGWDGDDGREHSGADAACRDI